MTVSASTTTVRSGADALPSTAEVVVVGAGAAGLAAAVHLDRAGLEVLVVEAADHVGGRTSSEDVGAFRVDRGFQLVNPGYPEVAALLDVRALDLQPFDAGVAVHRGGRVEALRDPRRHPLGLVEVLRSRLGTPAEKAALARWALTSLSTADLKAVDGGWSDALDAAGVDGELRWSVVEPFLAGVLGEVDGTTSRRFVDLVVRSFVRGTPGLPAAGVQAVPDQLAARLPSGAVVTGVEVRHVGHAPRSLVVETAGGGVSAEAVVVATDGAAAAHLVPGWAEPAAHGLATFWYAAATSPAHHRRGKLLHLDGDRSGPVVNTAVVSEVNPGYLLTPGDGRALVAASALGADTSPDVEARVRAQLGRVYGVDSSSWTLVTSHSLPHALPALPPPFAGPRPVEVGEGVYVAGDHRENPSLQGALVSGRRAADAVAEGLGLGRGRTSRAR